MTPELKSILETLCLPAGGLRFREIAPGTPAEVANTRLGGLPYAEAGEKWPVCEECTKELAFIGQFRLPDSGHGSLPWGSLLTFFYCWHCSSWGFDGEKRTWEIRTHRSPAAEKAVICVPLGASERPIKPCRAETVAEQSLPAFDGLEYWSPRVEELCCQENPDEPWEVYFAALEELGISGDVTSMFGGYPQWIQGDETPDCPECDERMQLMVQIASEEAAELMWGDAGAVYLFSCPSHPEARRIVLQCY